MIGKGVQMVGIVGSLAVRPPGQTPAVAQDDGGPAAERRINWRVPIAFGTNLPVIGDNILYVAETLAAASNGAVSLQVFEPGEIVPPFSITCPAVTLATARFIGGSENTCALSRSTGWR